MGESEFKVKRTFWVNVLKTVVAAFVIGVSAGAANSYIKVDRLDQKVQDHDNKFEVVQSKLDNKVDKREMDNLKEFLIENFDDVKTEIRELRKEK